MASDEKPNLDSLRLLLNSALDIVADLGHESTHRAVRALAAIPPDERSAIATALERAAVTWQQNEAFNALHQIRVRANPNAQLFVRVVDDVPDPAPGRWCESGGGRSPLRRNAGCSSPSRSRRLPVPGREAGGDAAIASSSP